MALPRIRIPLQHPLVLSAGRPAYRVIFPLALRNANGTFGLSAVPFRLDTGSDFTTIPDTWADQLGLRYKLGTPVHPATTSGRARKPSYLTDLWLSFSAMPQWQFRAECLVTPYPLKRGLFSLNDLVPHFIARSNKATLSFPRGSIVLQLRSDHGGVPRP
jgi:hypothetical protein